VSGLWSRLRARVRDRRRRLRFTREGKYFVAITIGVGMAAVNTGNNLLYLLLGWMLSVIVASGIMSEQVLRRLSVRRRPPPEIHAGSPFKMDISVANGKRRVPSFALEIEDLLEGKPLDKRCWFLKILAGRTQSAPYQHVFARRGLYRFHGFRIATRFPFGLFKKSRDLEAPGEALVYPALRPIAIPAAAAWQGGESPRARRGRRGEFFGLRELRQGDDIRDVHWRSSARHRRLLIREYEEESQRRAVIHLDNALPGDADEAAQAGLERAVETAASLAVAYLRRGYAVRLVSRSGAVASSGDPGQRHRILRALALLPAAAPGAPFAGVPDGGAENLLVARPGAVPAALPPGIGAIVEAA
jgi:uncharacterized protein (DUF58 family)